MPLRQRKKVQEMPRSLKGLRFSLRLRGNIRSTRMFQRFSASWEKHLMPNLTSPRLSRFSGLAALLLFIATQSFGSIWTDRLGDFNRISATPIAHPNPSLAEEYGLEAAERAEYQFGNRTFTATAYRMSDSTGATAMYQSLQPAGARPSEFEAQAVAEDFALFSVEAAPTTVVMYQNYVMVFERDHPTWQVVKDFLGYAPGLGISSRPTLPAYLPQEHLVPGSERYVLGPESLDLYLNEIPAGVAAFSLGAEAQVAEYARDAKRLKLAIISYPTPQMARKKLEEYQKLGTPILKREGSLIVFVPSPESRDLAERVLSQVNYRATVTVNEKVTTEADAFRKLFINIVIMVVLLGLLAGLAGIAFGGLRFLRKRNEPEVDEAFLRLHID